jgi:hypothetical protein
MRGGGEGITSTAGEAGLGGLPKKDGEVVGDSEADPKRSRRRWIDVGRSTKKSCADI